MATRDAKVGRSREELLAAAAALNGALAEVEDGSDAARLVLRAIQFEKEAEDAPPITAAGEVTDERVLSVVEVVWSTSVASFLAYQGVPDPIARSTARSWATRALSDPLAREELTASVRAVLAGGCSCGKPLGHEHPHGHAEGGDGS